MKKTAAFIAVFIIIFSFISTAGAYGEYQEAYSMGTKGIVCLTFDDGYGRKNVAKIIDTLHREGVRCTFFVVGTQLLAYPDLWRKAVLYGNEIAYHSLRHTKMAGKSSDYILSDIDEWVSIAKSTLGEDYRIPGILRFPGGSGYGSARIMNLIAENGYMAIDWNLDTLTGVTEKSKNNTDSRISEYILRKTRVNSIILLHFDKYNASALPHYIGRLKKKYTLGTVSEAFGLPPCSTYCSGNAELQSVLEETIPY